MKVDHRQVEREITEEEFLRLKKQEPFATFRQDAKACFPGSTQVYVKNIGWEELSKIVPEIEEGCHIPISDRIEILTPDGSYQKIDFTIYGKTQEWLEIELENGDVIKMTPNHSCIVVRNGRRIKIRADKVKKTDKFLSYQIENQTFEQ